MGNSQQKMTPFQREKLVHEFRTFYDLDGDGEISWSDFEMAKERACKLNNWASDSPARLLCDEVFVEVWDSLTSVGDTDSDGAISEDEWVKMWATMYKKVFDKRNTIPSADHLPMWCFRYLQHRFQLLDRAGDGKLDTDEYEYVMEQYGASVRDARKAFQLFSENETFINFEQFAALAADYYFSADPSALGNFIAGKLEFEHTGDADK